MMGLLHRWEIRLVRLNKYQTMYINAYRNVVQGMVFIKSHVRPLE